MQTLAGALGSDLFGSQEYAARQRTDQEFLTDLYHAYLQRAPDPGGYESWLGVIGTDGRETVHHNFLVGGEFGWLTTHVYSGNLQGSDNEDDRLRVFVHKLYLGALGREETSSEMSAAISQLNVATAQGKDQVVAAARELARGVYLSEEYEGRKRSDEEFVVDLFDGLLGRATNEITVAHLLLVNPFDREDTFDNLSGGEEFVTLASALYRDVDWLVSDQLGTPRMIVKKSGTLAAVSRHDYLPFGEDIFASTGGRSSAQGYGAADGVRQKFTQKERDIETGLDYFNARYYSNAQGRFTSADSFPGFANNPQTLNAYAYVQGNPLNFTDPTGHDAVSGSGACAPGEPVCQKQ